MALPLLKIEGGEPVALTWTRLKPASEVTTATPPPPAPIRRPGVSLGPERLEIVGEGFDRRTVVAADVVADDGLYVVGDREIKARGVTGQTLRYEPNRAWSPADMAALEPQALVILKAHDFPVHLEWPAGVWAWEGEDLFWADAPAHAVLIRDGVEDLGMSGVERGGVGWPMVPTFGRYNDAAALSHWPRFSPFGWALEVWDLQAYRRQAADTLARFWLESLVAEGYPGPGGLAPSEGVRWLEYHRAAEGILKGEAGPPTYWVNRVILTIQRDTDYLWQLGFEMGAYMTEHRLRSLHGEFLSDGQKAKRGWSGGAAVTNAKTAQKIRDRRAIVHELAIGKLSGAPPPKAVAWTTTDLALEIRDSWPLEGDDRPPKPGMLQKDIAALGGLAILQALAKNG